MYHIYMIVITDYCRPRWRSRKHQDALRLVAFSEELAGLALCQGHPCLPATTQFLWDEESLDKVRWARKKEKYLNDDIADFVLALAVTGDRAKLTASISSGVLFGFFIRPAHWRLGLDNKDLNIFFGCVKRNVSVLARHGVVSWANREPLQMMIKLYCS